MPSPVQLALSACTMTVALGAFPALADVALPAPYVSRALDAVLLPIDAEVQSAFDLSEDDKGVLVLATEPGGVADTYGMIPGDVIEMVGGQRIALPVEVDEIVYYWILEGINDIDLGVWRGGNQVEVISTITEESYWEVIEVTTVETWSSWEVDTSFSYEEYYAEYSEEIVESYETSETLIEETVTSEEYASEMSDEFSDEETEEAVDDTGEEDLSEEAIDDVEEDSMTDEEEVASEDDTSEDGTSEDDISEEEAVEDEASDESYEESAEDEAYDDAGDEADGEES